LDRLDWDAVLKVARDVSMTMITYGFYKI